MKQGIKPLVLYALLAVGLTGIPRAAILAATQHIGRAIADVEMQWLQNGSVAGSQAMQHTHRGESMWISTEAGDSGVTVSVQQRVQRIASTLSVPMLQKTLHLSIVQPVVITLFSTSTAYDRGLTNLGATNQEALAMARHTGGVAAGNAILIPMFQNEATGDLQNVLTHEMTHVALYQAGILPSLPTWLNEGLAWTEGLRAMATVAPASASQTVAMAESSILAAFQHRQGVDLTASESQLLSAPYNVELEDYMATKDLLLQFGWQGVRRFLGTVVPDGEAGAFDTTFHESQGVYVRSFDGALTRDTWPRGL